MIDINLISNQAKSNSVQAYSLEKTSFFGKKENETISYSPYEATYLVETKKAKVFSN